MWYEGSIQQEEVNDHGSIVFEAVDGGTRVVWDDTGTMALSKGGGLAAAAVGPLLSPAFEAYLLELKDVVENDVVLEDAQ